MPEGATGRWRPADVALAAEAAVWLAVAGLALRSLSFARIARSLAGPALRRPPPGVARRIGWAINAATRRAPWPALCFERALAACLMLRLRGLGPVLYYGARSDGALGPSAHVWLKLGEEDVVGGEEAQAFAVLATFPAP
jgi:hypothetical protein